ncbi:MAG: ribonuclease R [Cytophagaceae bacterium]|nr:ribonuclease R [Cytophagaceae bacterium]MDW8456617.1 ribonuclease R [Cytophagaceae bacterium]
MAKKISRQGQNFIREKLISFFNNSKKNEFSVKEILKKTALARKATKEALIEELTTLVREGKLIRLKNGFYKSSANTKAMIMTGTVDHVNPRFAYILSDASDTDVWVSTKDLHQAINGDLVKVLIHTYKKKNKNKHKPEGEVIEILERKKTEFVGKIEITDRFAFVIPDNKKIYFDIFIPLSKTGKAKHGQKVIAKVTQWPVHEKNPEGEVISVLGNAGDNDTEMHSIMAEFGLPFHFPPKVVKAAEKISDRITEEEIRKRRDFRNVTTFTIDPIDAKDFDDALSVRQLDNGNYEIGIHIADVTHYVNPDSELDREAYRRATSVYLVDRVVPMLPEKLSNHLCSLRPHEDKLTFSVVLEIDPHAKVISQWFGKTIIHSDRRFTYEEVQQILEEGRGEFYHELHTLNELAKKLRTERFKNGSISFETIEVKFQLDEKGKPLAVYPKIRKDAHKLIEEFMLLANKTVAEFIYGIKKGKSKNTMVYRTHDAPSTEKLASLATFAKRFGHKVNLTEDTETVAASLNQLADAVEGKPEQNVIQNLAIRAMAKAKYTTTPDMHFGLAFKHYTHFTSPIRRYPDMMVHRLLEHYLNGGKPPDKEEYEEKCEHSSEMEKLAAEAERASIKYKQVEFMQTAIDNIFEGIISGITEYGMFVEIIETRCEGMVRLSDMDGDYYEADVENYRIVGKRTQKIYTLGDTVNVKVKKADLGRRQLDLELIK